MLNNVYMYRKTESNIFISVIKQQTTALKRLFSLRKWQFPTAPLWRSIIASSIPKRINVFTADVYWACRCHYKPFKETCGRCTVRGVRSSHLRRPADVWSRCTAAAVPAGSDGCPIHTYGHRHLWSQGDLTPASASVSNSVTGCKTSRIMSSVHGNMNHFQMYHDGPLQMSSVVNSGWWLAALCVNYARVRRHVSGIRWYLTLLSEKCVRFVFRLWSVGRNQLLQLGKFRSEGGQMRRNTDPQEKEDQLHAAANRGAGESLLRH